MISDIKLIELRKNKNYKKSHSLWHNYSYTRFFLEEGLGAISVNVSLTGTFSLSVLLVKLFWIVLKHYFITKEFVLYRKSIIESSLSENALFKDELLKRNIRDRFVWMQYKIPKLRIMRKACTEYLNTVENRILICEVGGISGEEYRDAVLWLDERFKMAFEEIIIVELTTEYSELILNPDITWTMTDLFERNGRSGFLSGKDFEMKNPTGHTNSGGGTKE